MMEGVNSSMICLIYYKNICKCHNIPPLITTIKKLGNKEMLHAVKIGIGLCHSKCYNYAYNLFLMDSGYDYW
jgi:hypothetical protein